MFVPNVACEFSTGIVLFISSCYMSSLFQFRVVMSALISFKSYVRSVFARSCLYDGAFVIYVVCFILGIEVSRITWLYQYNVSKFKAKFLKHIISPMNTLNILLWSNYLAYAVTHLLNINTKLTKEFNPRFLVEFVICAVFYRPLSLSFWSCLLTMYSLIIFKLRFLIIPYAIFKHFLNFWF